MNKTNSKADISIHKDDLSIVIKREIAARPRQVYDAWTKPEELRLWWDPAGAPLDECDIDLREGGHFRFLNRGDEVPFSGTYRTIDAPKLVELEAMGAHCKLEFRDSPPGTLLLLSIICPSSSIFDAFIKMGVDRNTGRSVDNLANYLESTKPSSLSVG